MKAKLVRRLLNVWPCIACLGLAALSPIFAQEPKPPAKTPDIQGTWNLVSWEKNAVFSVTNAYCSFTWVSCPQVSSQ
jgi:hypothetical protein